MLVSCEFRKLLYLVVTVFLLQVNTLQANQEVRFSIGNKNTPALPPYQWFNFCTNDYEGLNKQLYRRFAYDLGVSPVYIESEVAYDSISMQNASLALITDGVADFGITHPAFVKDKPELMISETPVFSINRVLVFNVADPDIQQINELESMQGMAISTAALKQQFHQLGVKLNIEEGKTMRDALIKVASKEIDYWLTTKFIAQYLISETGLENTVKYSKFDIDSATSFYLVAKRTAENELRMRQMEKLLADYLEKDLINFLKFNVMKNWLASRSCSTRENSAVTSLSNTTINK